MVMGANGAIQLATRRGMEQLEHFSLEEGKFSLASGRSCGAVLRYN